VHNDRAENRGKPSLKNSGKARKREDGNSPGHGMPQKGRGDTTAMEKENLLIQVYRNDQLSA
jgi:hypothetical protein